MEIKDNRGAAGKPPGSRRLPVHLVRVAILGQGSSFRPWGEFSRLPSGGHLLVNT